MTITSSFVHYYSSTFLLFFGSITSYYYSISENLSVAAYYWQELKVLAGAGCCNARMVFRMVPLERRLESQISEGAMYSIG